MSIRANPLKAASSSPSPETTIVTAFPITNAGAEIPKRTATTTTSSTPKPASAGGKRNYTTLSSTTSSSSSSSTVGGKQDHPLSPLN